MFRRKTRLYFVIYLIYSIIVHTIHLVNIVAVKAKQNSRKMSCVHVNHSYVCPTIYVVAPGTTLADLHLGLLHCKTRIFTQKA